MLILRGKRVDTLAPTDPLVIDSDQAQERAKEGPCFDAARHHRGERVFRIADFTEVSETAGWLLASHAAVALSSARSHAQMERAVATRHVIGEAMGVLLGSHHLTEEQAFDVLGRYPQDHNIKLREVARQVCEKGSLS